VAWTDFAKPLVNGEQPRFKGRLEAVAVPMLEVVTLTTHARESNKICYTINGRTLLNAHVVEADFDLDPNPDRAGVAAVPVTQPADLNWLPVVPRFDSLRLEDEGLTTADEHRQENDEG
jgi:hypothetical protein